MKHLFRFTVFIAALLMAASCKWVSVKDTKRLQHEINLNLYGSSLAEVFGKLGHPNFVERDTIEGQPITVLHFEDKIVLQDYAHYAEDYQTEDPYIIVYMNNGKAYSTKTNLVGTMVSKNEWTISIVKLSTWAGVLVMAVVLTFIALMRTRRKKLDYIEEGVLELFKKNKNNEKDISDLYSKLKRVDGMHDAIYKLKYSIERIQKQLNTLNSSLDDTKQKESMPDELISHSPTFDQMDDAEKAKLLSKPLGDCGLSTRTFNCLKAADIYTIGELCKKDGYEIRRYRNFGRKAFTELDEFLKKYGLSYGMDLSAYGYGKGGAPIDEPSPSSAE